MILESPVPISTVVDMTSFALSSLLESPVPISTVVDMELDGNTEILESPVPISTVVDLEICSVQRTLSNHRYQFLLS